MTKYEQAANEAKIRLVNAASGWVSTDYIGDDELIGLIQTRPPFGSPEHRFISTVLAAKGVTAVARD